MIYLNLGRREVGKTTLAYYLISKLRTRVIFDPRGLFPATGRATTENGIAKGFYELNKGTTQELVITPDADVQGSFDQTCAYVKEWLRAGRSDIGFVVDELRFIPEKDGADLNWILRCATRDSVAVVFTAHRPSDVSTDIRAISDVWCIFQMTQEHDLKAIAERCSPNVAQQVARLPARHFISWNDAAGRMSVHTHPERWHIPLRETAALTEYRPVDDLNGSEVSAGRSTLFDFTE